MSALIVCGDAGVGSFGRVYKGRRKFTGQFVAMKVYPLVCGGGGVLL